MHNKMNSSVSSPFLFWVATREFAFEAPIRFLLDSMTPDFSLRCSSTSKHSLGISNWCPSDSYNSPKLNSSHFPMTSHASSGVNGRRSLSYLNLNADIFHSSVFSPPKDDSLPPVSPLPHWPFTILWKSPPDSPAWILNNLSSALPKRPF